MEIRSLLTRLGIHGWGESTGLDGIVIFATNRLKPREDILSFQLR